MIMVWLWENIWSSKSFRLSVKLTVNCPTLLFKIFGAYHFDSTQHLRVAIDIEIINNNIYFRDN